jgi:hypothetical protein
MAAVRHTPMRSATRTHAAPRRSRPWVWRVFLVVAAVLLLVAVVGGVFWYLHERPQPKAPLPDVWNDGDLRTRLVQQDLRLADAKTALERLDALTGMASELQREATRQAGRVESADLTRLAMLYERVIRDGILPHLRELPADERRTRLPTIIKELRQAEGEAEQTARQTPAAAEPLRRLAHTASDASHALEKSSFDLPGPKPKAPASTSLLIESLVVQGLRLADETDPLKRADICIDVADGLVRTIIDTAKNSGDRQEMVRLGTYLGALDRSAADNLKHVDGNAAVATRQAEVQRVRRRAEKAMEDLRRSINEAPPAARPALELGVEATALDQNRDRLGAVAAP